MGAVIAKAGAGALVSTGILKTVAFIFVSPLLGFLLGSLMMVGWPGFSGEPAQQRWTSGSAACNWFLPAPTAWATAATMRKDHRHHLAAADCHRLFDHSRHIPPTWTIVSCCVAIGLGTMFGGWRIVKTMGQKIASSNPWAASVLKPVVR